MLAMLIRPNQQLSFEVVQQQFKIGCQLYHSLYTEAEIEQALVINQEVLGKQHPDTAESLTILGILLQNMDEFAAAKV